jgi:hypothetical protein
VPKETLDKLRQQQAALDRLIEEAERLRKEVTAQMNDLHRGDSPSHPGLPPRKPRRPH